MKDLPEEFTERLKLIIPEDKWGDFAATFSRKRNLSLRINTLKTSIAEGLQELASLNIEYEQLDWLPEAIITSEDNRSILSSSKAFNEGRIYIQGLSSMLAAFILKPIPGETNLDLAAAPGGKTLHMAAMMNNEGKLSAVEAIKGRFFKLKANLETYGASMVRTFLMDGRAVGRKCPEMFDRVLLDAPCSSEARITALDPKSWAHWTVRKVGEAAKKQKGLISSAWHSLKPGGLLLYCTCSFAPEENELTVQKLLRRFEDAEIIDVDLQIENKMQGLSEWKGKEINPELTKSVRVLPNENMDGFFLCLLRKNT